MRLMHSQDFAHEFGTLYRELYRLAVRRVDDARDVLSAETTALLLHLSQTGPQTLSELTMHLDRAPSTLSAKVAELESQGLLARQRDESDARRALIWMTPAGREALLQALEVLDTSVLASAAERVDPARLTELLGGLRALIAALPITQRRTP
jgi:DNA-binding MarR family transcriptional regulator